MQVSKDFAVRVKDPIPLFMHTVSRDESQLGQFVRWWNDVLFADPSLDTMAEFLAVSTNHLRRMLTWEIPPQDTGLVRCWLILAYRVCHVFELPMAKVGDVYDTLADLSQRRSNADPVWRSAANKWLRNLKKSRD